MRVTQYQTKEMASLGDSSPLAEPVTAPSPHGCPLTDARPLPPPLSTLPLVFSNLHAGQNTRLLLHAKPSPEKLRTPGAQDKNPEQRVNDRENLTIANAPASVLAGGDLPVDLSMTSLFGLLQSAPSFSPLETASDLQQ